MSRRVARDSAYKLIFEYLFRKEKDDFTLELLCTDSNITQADKQYIQTVYEGVMTHFDELTELISSCTTGFNPERIFKPDLAALLLAVYEMKYMDDIPLPGALKTAMLIKGVVAAIICIEVELPARLAPREFAQQQRAAGVAPSELLLPVGGLIGHMTESRADTI